MLEYISSIISISTIHTNYLDMHQSISTLTMMFPINQINLFVSHLPSAYLAFFYPSKKAILSLSLVDVPLPYRKISVFMWWIGGSKTFYYMLL